VLEAWPVLKATNAITHRRKEEMRLSHANMLASHSVKDGGQSGSASAIAGNRTRPATVWDRGPGPLGRPGWLACITECVAEVSIARVSPSSGQAGKDQV
jgi:hypothetical protein